MSLVHDAVHVEGGRFLAVTRCHGKVLEIDLAAQSTEDVHVSVVAEPLDLTGPVAYFDARASGMQVENHLVHIDGELYLIWAALAVVPPQEGGGQGLYRHRIEEGGAVRYDPEQSTRWAEVEDLGDWAVLVGRSQTVAVRAGRGRARGDRGSCVYFTDTKLQGVVCV